MKATRLVEVGIGLAFLHQVATAEVSAQVNKPTSQAERQSAKTLTLTSRAQADRNAGIAAAALTAILGTAVAAAYYVKSMQDRQ